MPIWFKKYTSKQYHLLISIIFITLLILVWITPFILWAFSKIFPKLPFIISIYVWLVINIFVGHIITIQLGHKITGIEKKDLKKIFYGLLIIILLLILLVSCSIG